MPFPVKGTSTETTQGIPYTQFYFELLETGNNETEPTWHLSGTSPPQQTSVPEFGSMTGMIVLISIIGVIVISTRFIQKV